MNRHQWAWTKDAMTHLIQFEDGSIDRDLSEFFRPIPAHAHSYAMTVLAMEACEIPGLVAECTCDACPVQYEGTIDGRAFYFRSRGGRWSFAIGSSVDAAIMFPDWYFEQSFEPPFGAGWIDEGTAWAFMRLAVALWRAGIPSGLELVEA